MLNVKRWIGLIGLTVLVSVLVTGLMSGTALAQGPNPQPGNGWGPGMMNGQGSGPGYNNGYGYGHHGMMNGWGYDYQQPGTMPGWSNRDNVAPNGYGYNRQPGMMGRWNYQGQTPAWGQHNYRHNNWGTCPYCGAYGSYGW